jgi:hypothetical protein
VSAWIVSKKHIDYLVTAIVRAELMAETPDEIGRMLWKECIDSVAYRYAGSGWNNGTIACLPGSGPEAAAWESYTWTETPELTAGGLAKTVGCYSYQSCEHDEWPDSEACRVVTKLRESLGDVGYDDSVPWGW